MPLGTTVRAGVRGRSKLAPLLVMAVFAGKVENDVHDGGFSPYRSFIYTMACFTGGYDGQKQGQKSGHKRSKYTVLPTLLGTNCLGKLWDNFCSTSKRLKAQPNVREKCSHHAPRRACVSHVLAPALKEMFQTHVWNERRRGDDSVAAPESGVVPAPTA